MRADRLLATVLLLQRHGRLTAAALAEEHGISVATARRDLEALARAGVPVYPQPGRGGGWSLVGGARTDLTGLSAPEARALFLLVGPAAGVTDEARTALRKLVRALPATFRAEAEAAASSVLHDRVGWGARPAERPPVVETLQDALVRRVQVRLAYARRDGRPSTRSVDPWALVDKDGQWYLLAGTDDGHRTFRLDRVRSVEALDRPASRPDDAQVAAVWSGVVEQMEARRSRTWATVRVPAHLVFVLQSRFGRHCEVVDEGSGPRAVVRVAAPTVRDLARDLAGWGGMLEVAEPAELRDELVRLARDLLAVHRPR